MLRPTGFIVAIRKGTESEKRFDKAAFEEMPVEISTDDFKVRALVIGKEDAGDAVKYTLETIKEDKP